MTKAEREVVQKRVEMIHRSWTKERNYLAPPALAKSLAHIESALVVAPPSGLEVGYVPIVTRQESAR